MYCVNAAGREGFARLEGACDRRHALVIDSVRCVLNVAQSRGLSGPHDDCSVVANVLHVRLTDGNYREVGVGNGEIGFPGNPGAAGLQKHQQ